MPTQERIMTAQFKIRGSAMQWTDKRAKILLEILSMCFVIVAIPRMVLLKACIGSMRIVKYFTYELPFLQRE